ncbi:hypothetical protein UlMin_000147 [Ulmus minor]
MADQEEGWPLGLGPLKARLGLMRSLDFSVGSFSFNTLLTASPTSSTVSSSDLDTQSTGSFYHDKSKTPGSFIGVSSILELSLRSSKPGRTIEEKLRHKKMSYKSKPWLYSLCSKLTTDALSAKNNTTRSLGHFLEAERKATSVHRRNQSPVQYGPKDYRPILSVSEANSLFVGGLVVPRSIASGAANVGIKSNTELYWNMGMDH